MKLKFKNIILTVLLPVGLTACLDTGGELDRGSLSGSEDSSSVASGAQSGAALPDQGEAEAGDIFYNTTDGVLYVNDGTGWGPTGSSGSSNSVITDPDPTANLPSANSGDIAYNSTSNELQYFNGTSWVNTSTGAAGDDLGDHTSTQNLKLGSFQLVGNGGSSGVSVANDGNVGIGTTAPSARLETIGVNGLPTASGFAEEAIHRLSAQGVVGALDLGMQTGTSSAWIQTRPNKLDYSVGLGSAKLLLNPIGGNVGIGTTSPSSRLEVSGVAHDKLALRTGTDIAGDRSNIKFINSSGALTGFISGFVTGETGVYNAAGSGVTVDSVGNVGVGTTAPTEKLTVLSGTSGLASKIAVGDHVARMTVGFDTSGVDASLNGGQLLETGNLVVLSSRPNTQSAISFNTTDASVTNKEVVRIDRDGNVGIGTISPSSSLHVVTATSGYQLTVDNDNATSWQTARFRHLNQGAVMVGFQNTNSTGVGPEIGSVGDDLIMRGGAVEHVRVQSTTGNVGIGTTAPTEALEVNGNVLADNVSVPSDIKFKKDRKVLEGSLAKIRELTGYEYVWNEKARKKAGQKAIGVIAQEVEAQFPLLVSVHNKGKDNEYRSVNYQGLVAPLINAVKELDDENLAQNVEVVGLKAEVANLKAQNDELKARLLNIEKMLMRGPSSK